MSLDIKDFPASEIIRIEGINYSYDFFREWGKDGIPEGTLFRFEKRHGDITGGYCIEVSRVSNE